MEAATQVLLVPIFRHHWLWYAWGTAAATTQGAARGGGAAAAVALRHWREGRNLEEKAQLVGQSLSRKLQNRLWTEWHKLETARTGTLRNWGYRCDACDSLGMRVLLPQQRLLFCPAALPCRHPGVAHAHAAAPRRCPRPATAWRRPCWRVRTLGRRF